MTRIHIGADHHGFALAEQLRERAERAGYEVVRHGPSSPDIGDDYPIHAIRVGRAVVADQDAGADAFGLLVLDTAAGGVVAAGKANGVRAVAPLSPREATRARHEFDANVLVLEDIAFPESAWLITTAFVVARVPHSVVRGRQVLQISEFENVGTIEGWVVQLEEEQVAIQHPETA